MINYQDNTHVSPTMNRVKDSRFWKPLWAHYGNGAPSIAFCRVPELEYASALNVDGSVLDHCCGDGFFASLAWTGQVLNTGCDMDGQSVQSAERRQMYRRLDVCDVSQRLPYGDAQFELIFDNSALEHIAELDVALAEVARVLSPEGIFAFNVLNHRYFEWWPLDESAKEGYKRWQPFYHALSLEEWDRRLGKVGLKIVAVEGYFDKASARTLALLDCEFSGAYLSKRPSRVVRVYKSLPKIMRWYWSRRLSLLTWKTKPDDGAGYFIKAARANG